MTFVQNHFNQLFGMFCVLLSPGTVTSTDALFDLQRRNYSRRLMLSLQIDFAFSIYVDVIFVADAVIIALNIVMMFMLIFSD